jgi:hypothetical protein
VPGRFENFIVSTIVRSPFHALLGDAFAVFSVRGRRSGKPISTPVNVLREGSTLTVVSLRTRTWWRNVRSGAQASVRLAGKTLQVRGEVLERPDMVREGLTHVFAQRPGHAKHFGLRLVDGRLSAADLQKVAAERVVVRLQVI